MGIAGWFCIQGNSWQGSDHITTCRCCCWWFNQIPGNGLVTVSVGDANMLWSLFVLFDQAMLAREHVRSANFVCHTMLQNAGKLRRRSFKVIRHNFTQAKLLEEAAVAGCHASSPAVSAATLHHDPSQAALAAGAGGWQQSAGSKPGVPLPGDTIHSLYTSNGSPYQNFQGRIM